MTSRTSVGTSLGSRIESLFAAASAQDVEGLTALMHPDIVVIQPASLPWGGTYRGRNAFVGDLFAQMTADFEIGMDEVRVIDGGEVVAAQMTCAFTSRKTGQALRIPYVEVYEFADDLIRTITVYPSDTKLLVDFLQAHA